jgi:hypothetical protein
MTDGEAVRIKGEERHIPAVISTTSVPIVVEAEKRKLTERHVLAPTMENANEKMRLVKQCYYEILEMVGTAKGKRQLLDMGFAKGQVESFALKSGLDTFNEDTLEQRLQVAQIEKNLRGTENKKVIEAASKYANAIASEMLVNFTPYLCWKYGKYGTGQSLMDFNQLRDAQNYVAYSQTSGLYSMKGEINGKTGYVADVNGGLNDRYYGLIGYDMKKGAEKYLKTVNKFNKYSAEYQSKQVSKFENAKEIAESRDLIERIYLTTGPYVDASIPLFMAGLMACGPEGFALGAVYFGGQAKKAFEEKRYVEGALIALSLTGPAFAELGAASKAGTAARRLANAGMAASAGAGITFQAMMARDAAMVISSAVQQGWSKDDIASLVTITGFAAMAGSSLAYRAHEMFVPVKTLPEPSKAVEKIPAAASSVKKTLKGEEGFTVVPFGKTAPPVAEEKMGTMFLLDTQYIIQQLKYGRTMYEVINRLEESGDVVITEQVYSEVLKNLDQFRSDKRKKEAIEDIHRCQGDKFMVEHIAYLPKFRQDLSDKMARESANKNKRVGDGETSLIYYYMTVAKDMYKKVKIISGDTDIPVLVRGTELGYETGEGR